MRRAFGWSVVGAFVLGFSGCGGGSSAPVASNPVPPVQPAPVASAPVAPAPVAPAAGTPGQPAAALPGFAPTAVPGDPGAAPAALPGFPPTTTPDPATQAVPPAVPVIPSATPEGVPPATPNVAQPTPEGTGTGVDANLPKSYLEASQLALKEGKDRDGLQLLYAHTLAELKMDSPAGANLRWIGAAGRPAAAIRWGIGIQYTPERGYEGAPPELGKEPKGGEPANGAGGTPEPRDRNKRPGNKPVAATGNAAGGAAVNIPSEPLPMLRYFTAELGDKVLEKLQKQVSKGAYGEPLKMAAASTPIVDPANPGVVNANPGQPGAVSGGKDAGLGRLSPGLVMLGKGTTKELIERANEEGLEMMLVFDVSPSRTRTGKESSDTKVRIVEPITGKDIFATKNVNNIQLFMAREKPAGKADPLEEVVDLLLKNIDDKNCKLGEYPELTEDQVKGRYDKLLAQEFENPLPVLVELRSYFQRKQLSGALLFEAYKKFLGEEKAGVLAKGKVEEKREALSQWLPAGIKIAAASDPAATSVAGTNSTGGPGTAAVGPGVPVASPPLVAQPTEVPPAVVPPAVAQPGPGGAAAKFEIPGTTLSLPVPPGFTLGKDASGPYMINGTANIRAKREEKPMATVLRDYTAKNLELGGFAFGELKEVDALGQKVAIVTAVHTASKLKYMFAIMPEGETATIVVSAGYAPEDEIRLAPALMSAVMTMKLGK